MLRFRLKGFFMKKRAAPVFIWLLIIVALFSFGFVRFSKRLSSVLDNYIEIKLESFVASAINSAVEKGFGGGDYSSLIKIEKNHLGALSFIESDVYKLNMLKAAISAGLIESLDTKSQNTMEINAGSLLGSPLFLGRGPVINIRFVPAGSASLSFASEVKSMGINQSLHRILLDINVSVTVIRPGAAITKTCSKQVVLSETVIAGTVPSEYANINLGP